MNCYYEDAFTLSIQNLRTDLAGLKEHSNLCMECHAKAYMVILFRSD